MQTVKTDHSQHPGYQFRSAAESMSALSSLKKIEMGSNKLKKIPDFISCLTKLEYLSAFSNRLEEVTP
jgi:Leucine-rich repeat (LRR) protein